MPKKPKARRRERRSVPEGKVFIQSTFNNTIITITDTRGNVITWGSSGTAGYKGSRKGTPYAAQLAGQAAAQKAKDAGMRQAEVFVRGPGSGREAAIRAIQASGIVVTSIKDITPVPHNGCRPRKRRRV
jgi:small subunit ribosomal protein S11